MEWLSWNGLKDNVNQSMLQLEHELWLPKLYFINIVVYQDVKMLAVINELWSFAI